MPGDAHSALQTEIVQRANGTDAHGVLVKLRWSKDEEGYSVHIVPSSYTTSGYQGTDLLAYMRFSRSRCSFVDKGECYVRSAYASFDLSGFLGAFSTALELLQQAERNFNACGFALPQPEGWGYFFGRPSDSGRSGTLRTSDNGHIAHKTELMKQSSDNNFYFKLSWLEDADRKGWTIHYDPINKPLSAEMNAVLNFLGLSTFKECPYLDFKPCLFRFIPFQSEPSSFYESNANQVHNAFDAHAASFSQAVKAILEARATCKKFGFDFLSIKEDKPRERAAAKPSASGSAKEPSQKYLYDVAISFAAPERKMAESLAKIARDAGFNVFYDSFYPEQLWGKDLVVFFDNVFRKESMYCVIFISSAYLERMWTNHERRSAQARALAEKGKEYILPIQVDKSELPGLPSTIGYVSLKETKIEKIAELLIKKLSQRT
jgi:hypothetical protein